MRLLDAFLSLRRLARRTTGPTKHRINKIAAQIERQAKMSIDEARKTLDLSGPLDKETLQVRRRDLQKQYHPDINPDTADLSKKINEAYDILVESLEGKDQAKAPESYKPKPTQPFHKPAVEDPSNTKTKEFFEKDILSRPASENPGYEDLYKYWEGEFGLSRDKDGYLTSDSINKVQSYYDRLDKEYGSLGRSMDWHNWASAMMSLIYAWKKNYVSSSKGHMVHKDLHEKSKEKAAGHPATAAFKQEVTDLINSLKPAIDKYNGGYAHSDSPNFTSLEGKLGEPPSQELERAFYNATNNFTYSMKMHSRDRKPALYTDVIEARKKYKAIYNKYSKAFK